MSATAHAANGHKTTDGCRFCWMCRHVCPVGHVTKKETHTPHGWALQIDAVGRGTHAWHADAVEALYQCADCGMCQSHCVTNQALPDAIAAARADVAAAGRAPARVLELHERLQRWGSPYGDPGPRVPQAAGAIGLYVSDVAQHLQPRTAAAAQALLAAADVTVVPVASGRASGLLASSLGFPETARVQAGAIVEDVRAAGCRTVLVLAPADRFAFERLYRERLGVAWPDGVEIKEVVAVLADAHAAGRLRVRRAGSTAPYAYQDPDHAPRVRGDGSAARALLAAIGDATAERRLFWRDQRGHPTGAVGGLELTQPAIAHALAAARFADASAAGATRLVTEDPGALHHLASLAPAGVRVEGLFELLEAALER